VYALSTLGLVLVYRGSGVLNFAQGAIAGVGAYAYYELHFNNGVPTAIAVILAIAGCAVVGAAIHFLVMRPLNTAPPLTRVIATLGVMTALEQLGLVIYGTQTIIVHSFLPTDTVSIFGNPVSQERLILLGISCAATAALWGIYKFTRFGLATTAVAENEQTAQLCGHSPNRIALVNWLAGCALAGIAGVLVVPISGLNVDTLVLMIVPILAVGLVGGFSSFPITLAAALVIGIIQSEMARYITSPGWSESVPFLAVMLILIVRGRPLPVRSHVNERLPDIGSGVIRPLVAVPLIALSALLILLHPLSWSNAVIASLLFATICVSVIITTGYAGQLSLAQFAFAGFAGLVATRLSATQGWPFLGCALLGIAAAVPVGFIVGLPAVRTRGINLAIITFGLAFAMQSVIFDSPTFTGGVNGTVVKSPSVFGWSLDSFAHPRRFEFAALIVLVLALLVASNLRRGRVGRRLIAVRSNERAAASLGLSVPRAKLFAFAISAGVAGMAGVLIAFENTYVQYSSFDVFSSVNAVIGSVLGGVGYLAGALIGGFGAPSGLTSRIVDVFTNSGNIALYVSFALALLLIVTLIANPNGIASVTVHKAKTGAARMRRRGRASARPRAKPAPDEVPRPVPPAGESIRRPRAPVRPLRLVVDDLTVRFGGVTAVDKLSLVVEPGKVVGLMGPNGAGKTTLIDAVTGFVAASSGTVRLDDKRIGTKNAAKRAAHGVSRTFQSLELFEEISVADNIRVAIEARQRGVYWLDTIWPRRTQLTATAKAAISILGLADDLDRHPGELPLGRRRLVSIARAIASEPSVLLLDEPAAGLDEDESEELGRLIRGLADEWGYAILLVEHDVPLLMSTCDTVVAVDHGSFVTSGPPQEVRHHPKVIESYLGEESPDGSESAGTPTPELGVEPIESGQ
jgi:sulfate-transporting ATPase